MTDYKMIKLLMPTYHRAEELHCCLNALKSQIVVERMGPEQLQIFIYDNNSDEDVKTILKLFDKEIPRYCNIVCGSQNIGKAKALNTFTPDIDDGDVVVSLDSDLVIEPGSFFSLGRNIIRRDVASVIVAEQSGDFCHKLTGDWLSHQDFHYKQESQGMGIAGGCLFINGKTWRAVGGYRMNRGIYGGNDGWLLFDAAKFTGKPVLIIKEITVCHPEEKDDEYRKWKKEAHEQQDVHGRCLFETGYYENKMKTF